MTRANTIWRSVALAGSALAAGCGGPQPAKLPPKPVQIPKATGIATGLTVLGRDTQGRRLYEVRSLKSTQSAIAENATLTNTRVTLYHEGTPDVLVVAPYARVDAKSKDLVMWGGLSADGVQTGASFRLERLTWNAGTKAFTGTGGVRYTRGQVTASADRLRGKTPLTRVNLDGNVRMNIGAAGATEANGR